MARAPKTPASPPRQALAVAQTEAAAALRPKRQRPPATPEQKAERKRLHECRVEYVADMMRELTFRSGVTTNALADAWDLPLSYTREIVYEASRRVRSELTDQDRVMSKVSAALDRVIDDAIDSGDRHAVIKAVQVWAQVTGAGAATKVQVQQDLTSLTPEQLQARKQEILARLSGRPVPNPAPATFTPAPDGED